MSSMTMAAPRGDSTYSCSRTTFGSSMAASAAASLRNRLVNPASDSRLCRRYLIATKVPEASSRATTTSPNPPEPSVRSPVNPGTFQPATPIGPLMSQQLMVRSPDAVPVPGPSTSKVTAWDAVPWPWPWTATVT